MSAKDFSQIAVSFFMWLVLFFAMVPPTAYAEEAPNTSTAQKILANPANRWVNLSRPPTEKELQDRIILLDFWTYCCINCMHVIPDLHKLEHDFGDKLTVIGVHSGKFANERDDSNIRAAMLRYAITHPVINDNDFALWQSFGIQSWPSLVLISPQGTIASAYSGEGHYNELYADIKQLIDQNGNNLNHTPLPLVDIGNATHSILAFPAKFAYAPAPYNLLFITDSNHNRILGFTANGNISLQIGSGNVALTDGDFSSASFNRPQGIIYRDNKLYVADTENHALRSIDLQAKTVTTLAGTGIQGYERNVQHADGRNTRLSSPWDVTISADGNQILIAMAGTHQLWSYNITNKQVSVIAGNGREFIDDGTYPDNSLAQPSGISRYHDIVYFVDAETSSLRQLHGNSITTLIGTGLFDFGFKNGKQPTAKMQHPLGLYAEAEGVYIADSYNHSIRFYDVASGTLSTLAGDGTRGNRDGHLHDAEFNEPAGLIKIGSLLYVADTNNQAIRIIDPIHDQVSTLPLTSTAQVTANSLNNIPTLAKILPNVEQFAVQNVQADTAITVTLHVPDHWKINHDAPSWLNVFAADARGNHFIKAYAQDEIVKKILTLPPLQANLSYRIQASFYYCQDKAGSLCLLKSIDMPLQAESAHGMTHLEINLPVSNQQH